MLDIFNIVDPADLPIIERYIGSLDRKPDLIIAPDGNPYLYRWFAVPCTEDGGARVYFHMQVSADPERPLHDHPWDNMSVILSGGYLERMQLHPPNGLVQDLIRVEGDVIFRRWHVAHRLFLPIGVPYTLTQFSTGPKVNAWGFWYGQEHVDYRKVTDRLADGRSVHKAGQPWRS